MANEFKIKKGLIVTGATSGTVVDVQGSQGQLFSVTDDLSGSIFAVSDISGVPILDVNSSGLVTIDGPLTQTGGGDSNFSGDIILQSATPKISLIDTDAGDSFSVNNFTGNFVIKNDTDNIDPLIINGANNATFAGDITTDGSLNINRLAGGTPYDNFKISTSDIFTTLERVENTADKANGYGRLDFKTNATVGISGAAGRGGFKFIAGDGNNILYLENLDKSATFSAQAFSAATSSGDASSTLTTKGYVDGLITGATIYRGAWDPSGGGYGSPDLSGVTQTSGYYYICSADGTAEPNGTGTEPDSWAVGDWVIYNNVSGTGQWQKIDNSSVLSGVGTGQTVALWEGSASVTDSETLGNAPITVSGSNTTFAGDVGIGVAPTKELQVNGEALFGNGTDGLLLSYSGGNSSGIIDTGHSSTALEFRVGNTQELLINGSSATFAGDVLVEDNLYLTDAGTVRGKIQLNSSDRDNLDIKAISLGSLMRFYTVDTLALTLDDSQDATFAGNATIETGINLESGTLVIKNATSDTNGLRIFQDSSDASKIHNNYNGTLQLGVNNTTTLTLGSSLSATFAGDITQADGKRIWFRGSSASSGVGAQSYVFSDGLNLKIKGDDNVQILGDGGGTIAHFDYTGKVGIGTTLPKSQLQVAGGIQMANDTAAASADKVGTMRYRTGTEYVDVTGTELITNGNFASSNNWSVTGGWTIGSGKASYVSGNTAYLVQTGITLTSGVAYRVKFNVSGSSGNGAHIWIGNQAGTVNYLGASYKYYANGDFEEVFTMPSNQTAITFYSNSSSSNFSLDNVTLLQVTAEDASYADMCMQTGASTYEWVNIVRNTY